jgi:molybdopterin-containing oxidoreductase family membrane subunit
MSRNVKVGIAVMGLTVLAATGAWAWQLGRGLVVTDMQNGFTWGLYVAGLAFFVGNAAGGLVLSSSIYLFGAKHLKPFARLGALTAFANVAAAMAIVLPDIGRPERLWNMVVHPNWTSPLVWDVVVLALYAIVSLVYLAVMMVPDLPGRFGRWARRRTEDPEAFSERWSRRLAPFALVFAISIHVVTAWIFSTQGARDWWFSAALAPDFIAVAVAAGTAVVLLAAVFAYGVRPEHAHAYRSMGAIILGAVAVHMFLMFNDFFIHAWSRTGPAAELLQQTWGEHPVGHAFEVLGPLAGAVLLMVPAVRRSAAGLVTGGGVLLLGVFVHRFLIMPAAMNAVPLTLEPLGQPGTLWSMPIATGRYVEGTAVFVESWRYFPTWVEWSIFAGSAAFVVLLILLGVLALPVIREEPVRAA